MLRYVDRVATQVPASTAATVFPLSGARRAIELVEEGVMVEMGAAAAQPSMLGTTDEASQLVVSRRGNGHYKVTLAEPGAHEAPGKCRRRCGP